MCLCVRNEKVAQHKTTDLHIMTHNHCLWDPYHLLNGPVSFVILVCCT